MQTINSRMYSDEVITRFNNCEGMQRLASGELSKAHYAALMRETYFYTRENPQIPGRSDCFFPRRTT